MVWSGIDLVKRALDDMRDILINSIEYWEPCWCLSNRETFLIPDAGKLIFSDRTAGKIAAELGGPEDQEGDRGSQDPDEVTAVQAPHHLPHDLRQVHQSCLRDDIV